MDPINGKHNEVVDEIGLLNDPNPGPAVAGEQIKNIVPPDAREQIVNIVPPDAGGEEQIVNIVPPDAGGEEQIVNIVPPDAGGGEQMENIVPPDAGGGVQPPDDLMNEEMDAAGLPPPVNAEDAIAEDGEEPKKKIPKREQNFSLSCVGQEISEDPKVPTTYRFHIQMNKDKDKRIYEVEAHQGEFHNAHLNWSKQIKVGFLYCPGPMSQFVEQIKTAILDYEERVMNEDGEVDGEETKKVLKLKQESVVEIDGKVYFISGRKEVYLFTDDAPYAKKLNEEEISNLSVKIIYNAKEKSYNFDTKEVMAKFFKLIKDFNSVQRPQHETSFPYACLQNMKGELYMVIEDHRICIFFCRVTNAGKSMALLVNDRIYNGKDSTILSGCSEAGLRKALQTGKVSRFDEIDKKDSGSVTKLMKAIWPPGGGRIETGYKTIHVNTTTIIATNSYPEEIMKIWRMPHADLTKFDFNFMGECSMEHVREDFQEILDSCLVQGGELNCGKPLLLALGYKILKGRSTGTQLAKWDVLVGNRNQRFSQGLVHLEGFCNLLISFAEHLEIPEEDIPTSITRPTYNCILKVKNLVAQQAERRASDLISDICKDPEEARKCLVIPKKGRKGVGICTSKLKNSSLWRSWMQAIINKLPEFDTGSGSGGRIRGRLVPVDELDELFPIVNELLNVTAEKILSLMADESKKKKKQSLKQLKDDVLKVCASEEEGIEENMEDEWDSVKIDEEINMILTDEEESNGEGEVLEEEEEAQEEGEAQEVEGGHEVEGGQEEESDQDEEKDALQFADGVFKCKHCKGKKWKTKKGAEAHVDRFHSD